MAYAFAEGANAPIASKSGTAPSAQRLMTLFVDPKQLNDKQLAYVARTLQEKGSQVHTCTPSFGFKIDELDEVWPRVTHLLILLNRPGFIYHEHSILLAGIAAGVKNVGLVCIYTDQSLNDFSRFIESGQVSFVAVTSHAEQSRVCARWKVSTAVMQDILHDGAMIANQFLAR